MSQLPPSNQQHAPSNARPNVNGVVGLFLSAFGFVGWLMTLYLIFSLGREGPTVEGPQDPLARDVGNIVSYLMQVATGIIGLLVFGFFSGAGTIVSAIGMSQEPRQLAAAGLGLGLIGLLIGFGLIVWRMTVWGFFS